MSERGLRWPAPAAMLFPMLPDEQLSPEQVRIFRGMSGQRRLQLAEQLYWSARETKRAAVRSQPPEWSEREVDEEVRRIFCMPELELFLLFARPLNFAQVRYMVSGSVAAILSSFKLKVASGRTCTLRAGMNLTPGVSGGGATFSLRVKTFRLRRPASAQPQRVGAPSLEVP